MTVVDVLIKDLLSGGLLGDAVFSIVNSIVVQTYLNIQQVGVFGVAPNSYAPGLLRIHDIMIEAEMREKFFVKK